MLVERDARAPAPTAPIDDAPDVAGRRLRSTFRPDIEGMRAVAILLVVAFHVGVPGLGGGFVGVDVFFVVSGYLITALLVDEFERDGRVDFAGFYARRIRRLLPAALVVTLVTLGASMILLSPIEITGIADSARVTSTYVSNLWFADQASHYFGQELQANPFLHMWSLAVEEQFYLVWPLLVVGALALGRRLGRARATLVWVVAAAGGLSFVACLVVTARAPDAAFFLSPTRAWEFAVGAIAVISAPVIGRRFAPVLTGAGLAAVGISALAFDGATPFPGSAAAVPVLGAAAVLVGGAADPRAGLLWLLALRPMQVVGRLSYGWYLWHWPLLVLAGAAPGRLDLSRRVAVVAVALALAGITSIVVERPFRFHPRLVRRHGVSLALGAVLTVLGLGAALGSGAVARRDGADEPHRTLRAAADAEPALYQSGCNATFGETHLTGDECVFGDRAGSGALVLFGDSHAAQWFPAVDAIAQQRNLRLELFIKDSCPAAEVTIVEAQLGRTYHECDEWRARAIDSIVRLRPDGIVVASAANIYVARHGEPSYAQVSEDQWAAGMLGLLRALDDAAVPVAVLADTPRPPFSAPACLSRHADGSPFSDDCTFDARASINDAATRADRLAVRDTTNAARVTMNDVICPGDRCGVWQRRTLTHRDSSHLTVAFVRRLTDALEWRMAEAGV